MIGWAVGVGGAFPHLKDNFPSLIITTQNITMQLYPTTGLLLGNDDWRAVTGITHLLSIFRFQGDFHL